MMRWQIRRGTSNRKLGRSAWVVSLSSDTCPSRCTLKGSGCYAESGPIALHWRSLDRGEKTGDGFRSWAGTGFRSLAREVNRLPMESGGLIRIGDVGDPSHRGKVSIELVRALGRLKDRTGCRVIIYTHCDPIENRRAAAVASMHGIALNFSADDVPAWMPGERVKVVPRGYFGPERERDGIVQCPAEYRDGVDCARCGWCARKRGFTVGFTAHGPRAASAELAAT